MSKQKKISEMEKLKKKPLIMWKSETVNNPWSQSGWWVRQSMVERICGKTSFTLEWKLYS